MTKSSNQTWPLKGAWRIIVSILWVLFALLMILLFADGMAESIRNAGSGVIGIMINQNAEGVVYVEQLTPGGPADKAGVRVGDWLLQVDSETITPAWTIEAVIQVVRGKAGTPVKLRLAGHGEAPREVVVVRGWKLTELVLVWLQIAGSAACFLAGWVLFFKRLGSGYALFVAAALVAFGVSIGSILVWGTGIQLFLIYALGPLMMLFVLLTFPNGRFVPAWAFLIGLAGALIYGTSFFRAPIDLFEWPFSAYLSAVILLFAAGFACQLYRYRRIALQVEKKQLRIAGLGAAAAAAVQFLINPLINRRDLSEWLYLHPAAQIAVYSLVFLAYAAFAAGLVLALLRSDGLVLAEEEQGAEAAAQT